MFQHEKKLTYTIEMQKIEKFIFRNDFLFLKK